MEKHAPEKIKTITLRPEQKWMSEDLKNMKRKVRSLERKYKTIKKPVVKQEHKILRLKYKKLLYKTKRSILMRSLQSVVPTQRNYIKHQTRSLAKIKRQSYHVKRILNVPMTSYNSSWIKLRRLLLT